MEFRFSDALRIRYSTNSKTGRKKRAIDLLNRELASRGMTAREAMKRIKDNGFRTAD